MVARQTPLVHNFSKDLTNIPNQVNFVLQKIYNDFQSGASLHLFADIAGIGNVDVGDFEDTQLRFYQDTSDSNKKWMVTKLGGSLFKSEFVAV